MKNYSSLEGMEVVFKRKNGGEEILIVAGCDQDIGLTLHKKGEESDKRICLNGPLSPIKEIDEWEPGQGLRLYRAMFYAAVVGIKKGVLVWSKMASIKNAVAGEKLDSACGGDMKCAFSQ